MSIAPLGKPVVPEVYMTIATSSSAGSAHSSAAHGPAVGRGRRVARRGARHDAVAQRRNLGGRRQRPAALRPRPARTLRNPSGWASPGVCSRTLRGTTTAPSAWTREAPDDELDVVAEQQRDAVSRRDAQRPQSGERRHAAPAAPVRSTSAASRRTPPPRHRTAPRRRPPHRVDVGRPLGEQRSTRCRSSAQPRGHRRGHRFLVHAALLVVGFTSRRDGR